jgi:F5/8 type C domain/Right handed beta helix region
MSPINAARRITLACALIAVAALPATASAQSALVEKAAGHPATASSVQKAGLEPAKANDGNTTTRWSSAWSDNQWWQVDLGSTRAVSQVQVQWEAAYATHYRIQTSTDGSTWTTAADVTASGPGERDTSFSQVSARYVRLAGLTRGTPYGFSFFELRVLGPADGGSTTPPTTPPSTPSGNAVYASPSGNDSTGAGTASKPYRTVTKAESVAQPGQTVYARAGSYGATTINKSGTSSAPITVQPYPGETASIDGTQSTKSRTQSAVTINGSYVRFKGFDVRNTSGRGISALDVTGTSVTGNRVHDTWVQAIMVTGDSVTVDSNDVYNTILSNANSTAGGGWPAAISSWSRSSGAWSTNLTIRDNTVRNAWGEGILPQKASGVTVAGNVVHDTWSVNIYLTDVQHAVVERNYTYSTSSTYNRSGRPADGVSIGNEGPGDLSKYVSDLLIRNNIITKSGYGIRFWYDSSRTRNNSYNNIRIINNDVKDSAAANVSFADVPSSQTQPTGNVLMNNVFYGAVSLADTGGWSSSHNWMVGSQGDPKLVSPVDGGPTSGFKVQSGSPLIGKGAYTSQAPSDFWGTGRRSPSTIGVAEG